MDTFDKAFAYRLGQACLVVGPLMFAMSTFFWSAGRYGATGGALVALSVPIWAYGIIALLDRVRAALPRYAAMVLLLTLLGTVGGAGFGLQGFFETAYGMDEAASLAALNQYPVTAGLLLWWLGPLFPLTLFALGAGLIRSRQLPFWIGALMCVGAVLFPISRIPRIEWIAHLVDVMLVMPFLVAATLRRRTSVATAGRRAGVGVPSTAGTVARPMDAGQ